MRGLCAYCNDAFVLSQHDRMSPRMSRSLSPTLSEFGNLEAMQEARRNVNLTWQADSEGPGW